MTLNIIKYINAHGLNKAIEDFKLKCIDYGHKVLLKYSIETTFDSEEARECRGLVLRKMDWSVMSASFKKFFNYGQVYAPLINLQESVIYKKLDGTLVNVYFDPDKLDICTGTTGTAEGEGIVYTYKELTFSQLFYHAYYQTVYDRKEDGFFYYKEGKEMFTKDYFGIFDGYTISFELTTPYNVVVSPHILSRVHLLSAKHNKSGQELDEKPMNVISETLKVPMAPFIEFEGGFDDLSKMLEGMPYSEEGYVVCDRDFRRVKVKNPAYVMMHYLKESVSNWRIIDVARSSRDDQEEFRLICPYRIKELEDLIQLIEEYRIMIQNHLDDFLSSDEFNDFKNDQSKENRKKIAFKVQDLLKNNSILQPFIGLFYNQMNDDAQDARQFLNNYSGKDLYKIITKGVIKEDIND